MNASDELYSDNCPPLGRSVPVPQVLGVRQVAHSTNLVLVVH